MKSKFGRRHMWLDVVELVRQLRPKDSVASVHYFSAIVKNEPAAAQNQTNYIEAMKIRNGGLLTVHLGRFKERTIRDCRRCGQGYRCGCDRPYKSYEEKETDVALGAMMVADAALRVADITLLISADTDLYPALVAVRRVNPDQRIYLGMPPGNTKPPNRLTSIGGVGWFFIREQALRNAQLPNIVTDPATGRSHNRPAKWI